jgi:hypothetical protein
MARILIMVICLSFITGTHLRLGRIADYPDRSHNPPLRALLSSVPANTKTVCLPKQDVLDILRKVSSARSEPEAAKSRELLFKEARRSVRCRKELVATVVSAMNHSASNVGRDPDSFYLWRDGAELLGDLKAAEALDLLISHLDLTNGLSGPTMAGQPAILGVIKMGSLAIPKLSISLRESPERKTRYYAVYCISLIGGPSAIYALKHDLRLESDPCVKQFIQVSIDNSDSKGHIRDRVKWYSAFICQQ